MSHLAVTVIKCSSVDTPAAVTHSSVLEKILFLTRDVFFLPFKIKAYTVPVTVLFVAQLTEMHKHTWHHVCVWITASRMPYLLVQTELLWFQMWEPALGDYSPGLGCWGYPANNGTTVNHTHRHLSRLRASKSTVSLQQPRSVAHRHISLFIYTTTSTQQPQPTVDIQTHVWQL